MSFMIPRGILDRIIKETQQVMDEYLKDRQCRQCKHTYYDHQGWMDEEQRAKILKTRSIGCRIAHCRCECFESPTIFCSSKDFWEGD